MKLIGMFNEDARNKIMEEILFDSYETIVNSIKANCTDYSYTPIYSYDRKEEDEKLLQLTQSFKEVMEWYIGDEWKKKLYETKGIK